MGWIVRGSIRSRIIIVGVLVVAWSLGATAKRGNELAVHIAEVEQQNGKEKR